MSADKLVPRGRSLALGSRWEATALEDIAHRLITDVVAQMGQGTCNAIIAPAAILSGHAHYQVLELFVDAGSSRGLTLVGDVELLSHERTVPAKDRVRFDDMRHLF